MNWYLNKLDIAMYIYTTYICICDAMRYYLGSDYWTLLPKHISNIMYVYINKTMTNEGALNADIFKHLSDMYICSRNIFKVNTQEHIEKKRGKNILFKVLPILAIHISQLSDGWWMSCQENCCSFGANQTSKHFRRFSSEVKRCLASACYIDPNKR